MLKIFSGSLMYKTTFELFNEETADQEEIGNSAIQEIFLFYVLQDIDLILYIVLVLDS